jgi:flagellin
MGFRIQTNVSAMNSLVNATRTNDAMAISLQRLSSGLRINSAADDAAGLTIADNLGSQKTGLGQSIRNVNDGIGILQTADNAMATQVKIADTIRVKANQSAQDGQSSQSRSALQNDITKLMSELDNISNTTTYNGVQLLDGNFTNKQFQVGSDSNQTIGVTIGNTNSTVIGSTSFTTTNNLSGAGTLALKFLNADNSTTSIAGVTISHSAGTGLGQLAAAINAVQAQTGISASFSVVSTGSGAVAAGNINGLVLNGVTIGAINSIKANDSDGTLVNALNQYSTMTGVTASLDSRGRLSLTSQDGRGIDFSGAATTAANGAMTFGALSGFSTTGTTQQLHNMGRLTLIGSGSRALTMSAGTSALGASTGFTTQSKFTASLNKVSGVFSGGAMAAAGGLANKALSGTASNYGYSGVTTMAGAQMTITIAQNAINQLDQIRSGIGSAVNQMTATLNNISVTQVNVAAAESQIRDTDFAAESSQFSKYNILAQSGSYALSQSNSMQQNVLRLLQ